MNEQNEQLARRWFQEVWNEQKVETINELTPPDLIGHHEMAMTRSRDDFKRFHAELLALLPDVVATVEDVLASATDVVVRWRFTGHSARDQVEVSFTGITWLKVRDGQFVEGWDRWNPAPLLALRQPL